MRARGGAPCGAGVWAEATNNARLDVSISVMLYSPSGAITHISLLIKLKSI